MKNIAIVYFSAGGHTQQLALGIAEGARSVPQTNAVLLRIENSDFRDGRWKNDETIANLDRADAIVFGSPTYMGTVSWQFKKFADASSKQWFSQQWKDKIFGGFTNSATMNGDKHSTLHYFFTLAMQHSGIWVGTGLMPSNSKAAKRDDVNYVGSSAGAMMQTPSDASADEVNVGDLETARLYGERIAKIAGQLKAK